MKAVRKLARGPGNVAVVEVEAPTPGPGQALVEVAAAGICGTDVHIVDDEFTTEPPVTLGHELAGKVAAVGAGVSGWEVGDRVTSETYFSTCGRCLHCRRGRPNLCSARRSIGSKEDGAFARYLVVPATNLHRVPDALPLAHAALAEPLACTVHGVIDTAGVRAGDRVAIAGPGHGRDVPWAEREPFRVGRPGGGKPLGGERAERAPVARSRRRYPSPGSGPCKPATETA